VLPLGASISTSVAFFVIRLVRRHCINFISICVKNPSDEKQAPNLTNAENRHFPGGAQKATHEAIEPAEEVPYRILARKLGGE
jgi:hypothetical protein